jgi:hypothetical protein
VQPKDMMNLKKMLGFILWFFFAMPSLVYVFLNLCFLLEGCFLGTFGAV